MNKSLKNKFRFQRKYIFSKQRQNVKFSSLNCGATAMLITRKREEIRSMVSGNISTDSIISTIIFGSNGVAK